MKISLVGAESSKNTQIWNFMKISLVGAESFHADGQTDTTKLIVALRHFAKSDKKISVIVDRTFLIHWLLFWRVTPSHSCSSLRDLRFCERCCWRVMCLWRWAGTFRCVEVPWRLHLQDQAVDVILNCSDLKIGALYLPKRPKLFANRHGVISQHVWMLTRRCCKQATGNDEMALRVGEAA